MTKEEKYTYWLELAQYDLDTAAAMFSSGRWFYVVFMCQQAVEKLCKGLYTLYLDDNAPKIHNIKQIFLGGVFMAVDFETVNRIAREYAVDVSRELPVDKAILFGSYAKGYAGEQSDIDICFFLKNYNGKRRVDLLTQILGVGGKKYHGAFFEPIVFETAEIQNGNPFIQEILATGIELI